VISARRDTLVQDIRAVEQEFNAGDCRPVTPDELMAEILA
jgi:hypothetical protein